MSCDCGLNDKFVVDHKTGFFVDQTPDSGARTEPDPAIIGSGDSSGDDVLGSPLAIFLKMTIRDDGESDSLTFKAKELGRNLGLSGGIDDVQNSLSCPCCEDGELEARLHVHNTSLADDGELGFKLGEFFLAELFAERGQFFLELLCQLNHFRCVDNFRIVRIDFAVDVKEYSLRNAGRGRTVVLSGELLGNEAPTRVLGRVDDGAKDTADVIERVGTAEIIVGSAKAFKLVQELKHEDCVGRIMSKEVLQTCGSNNHFLLGLLGSEDHGVDTAAIGLTVIAEMKVPADILGQISEAVHKVVSAGFVGNSFRDLSNQFPITRKGNLGIPHLDDVEFSLLMGLVRIRRDQSSGRDLPPDRRHDALFLRPGVDPIHLLLEFRKAIGPTADGNVHKFGRGFAAHESIILTFLRI